MSARSRDVTMELASLGRRTAAGLLDGLLLLLPLLLVVFAWGRAYLFSGLPTGALLWYPLLAAGLVLGYQFLCFCVARRTLGMAAVGLVLVSTDGRPVTPGQAAVRVLVSWLSALACGLGFLWALFHPLRQTWHDYAADTLVILAPRRAPVAPGARTVGLASRSQRGFTLIEMLVVIAIISILAAIMLPTYFTARERAKRTECASNLHQVAIAIALYADDNGGFTPPEPEGVRNGPYTKDYRPCGLDLGQNAKDTFGVSYAVADVLMDYAGDRRIFACPSEERERYGENANCLNWTYYYSAPDANISLGPPTAADYGDPSRVWLANDFQGQAWGSNHTARAWAGIVFINVLYLDGHTSAHFHPAPAGQDDFFSDHPGEHHGPHHPGQR